MRLSGTRHSLAWVTGADPPTSGALKTFCVGERCTCIAEINLPTCQKPKSHGFL